MEYIPVIGLEVHVQLRTATKMFCSCSTQFGCPPNTNVCPICLGMPGTLPVINKKAMDMAIKASLAINCTVEPQNVFARKNYFYPDLPKGYQISQFELPLATNGHLTITVNGKEKRIGITRLHVEDDAGKLIHGENLGSPDSSYVDLNRAGTPLAEIVSEPDLSSPEEAKEYLKRIKEIMEYLGVSDCNMEEGSLRCDANISVMPVGSTELGTRAEVKNMNSFKFLEQAIAYEIDRQIDLIEDGGKVVQETRLFNPDKGVTKSMRGKEEAHDYRYFPDPDLLPVVVSAEWVESKRVEIPELPERKRERYINDFGLPEYDAGVLTASKPLADFYEETVSGYNNPKIVSNWIMGEALRYLKDENIEIGDFSVTPGMLVKLLQMIDKGAISANIGKKVFMDMAKEGKEPELIVQEKGLLQVTDQSAIEKIVDGVLESSTKEVDEYRSGKEKVFGFLVGKVMKESKGKANPKVVNELLKKKLTEG